MVVKCKDFIIDCVGSLLPTWWCIGQRADGWAAGRADSGMVGAASATVTEYLADS